MSVGNNKLTLFGANRSIAVANLALVKVLSLLSEHPSEITCLRWVPSLTSGFLNRFNQPEIEFISGSSDGTLLSWHYNPSSVDSWTVSQSLIGHTSSILGFDVSLLISLFIFSNYKHNRALSSFTKRQFFTCFLLFRPYNSRFLQGIILPPVVLHTNL